MATDTRRKDIALPAGREPALGGDHAPRYSGLEPELGGLRRVKPDPQVMAMLLGTEDKRQTAVQHVIDKNLSRLYALELVKIISARDVRRLRGRRWGYAYTTDQRIAATRALEIFGQEVAVEALADALGDGAWWVGQYAIDALIAIGPPAVKTITGALNHRSPIVRRRAADVLGEIGDRRATKALIEAADDPEAWVRTRVVQALGRLRDPHALPTLQERLHDEDHAVARVAMAALARLDANAPSPATQQS